MLSWVEHEKSFITSGPDCTWTIRFFFFFFSKKSVYIISPQCFFFFLVFKTANKEVFIYPFGEIKNVS